GLDAEPHAAGADGDPEPVLRDRHPGGVRGGRLGPGGRLPERHADRRLGAAGGVRARVVRTDARLRAGHRRARRREPERDAARGGADALRGARRARRGADARAGDHACPRRGVADGRRRRRRRRRDDPRLQRRRAATDARRTDGRGVRRVTGADAVLRSLEAEGVETVFGLPGGAILPIYDALARGSTLRHVLARHEQGAGHMAEGYARASGRVGVAFATSGPGATNLVTPIADAWMDSTPLVCVTGQ